MYKLVLLDYSMPEMNGFECTQKIIEIMQQHRISDLHSAELVRMPFICCVTAYRSPSFHQKAKEASIDLVLIKPIFKEQVHELLIKSSISLQ